MCVLVLLSIIPILTHVTALRLNRNTPPMGWNSWQTFGCDISSSILLETADAMERLGLIDLGYTYLNIDDCWAADRSSTGDLIEDKTVFPDGIKPVIDYIHSKGLFVGLYSDAGNATCQGRPGSWTYETRDAELFSEWNIDYLKYDNCNNMGEKPQTRFQPMRDALDLVPRLIYFSMSEWGDYDPATWAPGMGANSWRTTYDIVDSWEAMLENIAYNDIWSRYAGQQTPEGFFGWNDPDLLLVGNGGLSVSESRVQFSLWVISKAPLCNECVERELI